MTSLARSTAIAAGVLMLGGAHSASAQIVGPVEFTTTFAFTVGNTTVPAGRYTIRPDDDNPQILYLAGAHAAVLFQTENVIARDTPAATEVVFRRYGDGYVLKDVWIEGLQSGAESITAEGEKHVMKRHGPRSDHRVAARRTPVETSQNLR